MNYLLLNFIPHIILSSFYRIRIFKKGAIPMFGPDMNLNDEQIDANSIDILYVSQTGCEATLDIELNGKRLNERFDCVSVMIDKYLVNRVLQIL
ncbi:unnamed protein product [Meloidogyne enterolobii]|uniref:Uncharacterized protein n=1 Tax=Meloidogyne enterolobii TaxID=390850 RepID=A0ACB0YY75_MELEN